MQPRDQRLRPSGANLFADNTSEDVAHRDPRAILAIVADLPRLISRVFKIGWCADNRVAAVVKWSNRSRRSDRADDPGLGDVSTDRLSVAGAALQHDRVAAISR
jgi:hypothetical protein